MRENVLILRGRHNALKRYRAPDDPELVAARRKLKAAGFAEHIRTELRAVDDIDAWADSLASALPPLTPEESAAAGRLAAVLDGRRDGVS